MSNNLKVRTKLYLIGLGFLIFIVFILFFSTHSMNRIHDESVDSLEEVMKENYDARIKEEVDVVLSILDVYNQDIEAGIFTREEGMKLAADEVRELRYGTAGYFWIDQSDGTNVVLLGNDTEGTNRMETTDANGYQMVKEIIRVAVEDGGGYTDYVFPKEGETESSPKRSYSAYFEPFDWVVGTGNYTDFIDDEVLAASKRINDITSEMRMILSAICLIFTVIVGSFLIRLIQHIVYPLKAIEKCIEKIAVGDLSARIDEKYLKKKDDFGILSNNIEKMRKNISGLIGNVKNEAAGISNVVDGINTEINELNSEIEDVSATTEQLAASMEETAATSDEIARMSQEIEDAAKNIAIRAQDGAGTAENIHERAMQAKRQAVNNREMIHTNKEQIKESLTKTLEEAKVVDQISVLAESIMGITEQTNLLSLNASIEAARAGEAGKGFAVVADEIRKLAEQSKENVENIQRVTGAVNGAVNNLKRDSERLLAFVDTEVSESFDKFEEMAETYNHDATEVNGLVADFSATSEELLASISSILESIDNISKATNDGAAGTTNIADKTVSVATRSDTVTANSREAENAVRLLNEGVGQFIIEE